MGRNFSPARNVRSITAPSLARRSFVRPNAPPLPGLTCWNSMILKTVPSTSMWFPFLNWLVLIMSSAQSRAVPGGHSRVADRPRQVPAGILEEDELADAGDLGLLHQYAAAVRDHSDGHGVDVVGLERH